MVETATPWGYRRWAVVVDHLVLAVVDGSCNHQGAIHWMKTEESSVPTLGLMSAGNFTVL